MKKHNYIPIAIGFFCGIVLGYLLMISVIHLSTQFMVSDDDVGDAVLIGLLAWVLISISFGCWGGYLSSSKSHVFRYLSSFIGITGGIVCFDNLFSLSSLWLDWAQLFKNRESVTWFILIGWGISAIAGNILFTYFSQKIANKINRSP